MGLVKDMLGWLPAQIRHVVEPGREGSYTRRDGAQLDDEVADI